jgi:hypothetical protein
MEAHTLLYSTFYVLKITGKKHSTVNKEDVRIPPK